MTLHADEALMQAIGSGAGAVEFLAGLEQVRTLDEGEPQGALPLTFEGRRLFLSGLVDQVDIEAERARLSKRIAEQRKLIANLEGRLANENYVTKAPAHLVEQTRAQLREAQADVEAAERSLEALDSSRTS